VVAEETAAALLVHLWSFLHYGNVSHDAGNSSAESVTLLQEILLHYTRLSAEADCAAAAVLSP
jgi:hypothetical protein